MTLNLCALGSALPKSSLCPHCVAGERAFPLWPDLTSPCYNCWVSAGQSGDLGPLSPIDGPRRWWLQHQPGLCLVPQLRCACTQRNASSQNSSGICSFWQERTGPAALAHGQGSNRETWLSPAGAAQGFIIPGTQLWCRRHRCLVQGHPPLASGLLWWGCFGGDNSPQRPCTCPCWTQPQFCSECDAPGQLGEH